MSFKKYLQNKVILSWALYDWANSAFATTIMAGFFPILFKEYWSSGLSVTESSYRLGVANSLGGLALALLAPFFGTLADQGQMKKKSLFVFTAFGIAGTAALAFVPKGDVSSAILLYALAAFGFSAAVVFYDSLLVSVSPEGQLDRVSGFGYALGYLGGGTLFVINVLMTLKPAWFGLRDQIQASQWAFLSVAAWWAIFSLPLFLFVPERHGSTTKTLGDLIKGSVRELNKSVAQIVKQRFILIFLIAYFFYIEAVNTTIKMAVDYGLALGFQSKDLIGALIIVQFVAFPFAVLFGWIGEKFGAVRGLFICLAVYVLNITLALQMTDVWQFYLLAGLIGTVQGGVQALSRSYYASMIPVEKAGEYFGFFNMLGKFSAVVGPFLVGWVSVTTGSPRSSIGVILTFFILGAGLLATTQKIRVRQS